MNFKIAGVICHTCCVIINNGDDSMYDIHDADAAKEMRRTFTLGFHKITGGRYGVVSTQHCTHDRECECSGQCAICMDAIGPFYDVEIDLDQPETPDPIICEETGSAHSYVKRYGAEVCRFCDVPVPVTGEVDA